MEGSTGRFMPKMPPRRKRVVKEEDSDLLQMLHDADTQPQVPVPTAQAGALGAPRAQPGTSVAHSGLQPPANGQGLSRGAAARVAAQQAASRQLGHGATVTFRASGAREHGQQTFRQIAEEPMLAQVADVDDWLRDPQAPTVLPFQRIETPRSAAPGAPVFPPGSAADVLLHGSRELSGSIFFLQLPPDLPISAALGLAPAAGKEDAATPREFGNRCKELGAGSLGKMRLHKSGRISFRLGEVNFEVRAGTDCACAQELMALSADKCCSLGDVRARMLCVPSIASLVAGVRAGGAQGDVKPMPHGGNTGAPHIRDSGQAGPSYV